MATIQIDPMKFLYTFTSTSDRDEALRRTWWLDPSIAYLHRKDVDVKIIPNLSHKLEEYAVVRIAQRINITYQRPTINCHGK